MFILKLKLGEFPDVVIGYLMLLTDSFLQGNWIVIIPLVLWIAIATVLCLKVERVVVNSSNKTKVVPHRDKKAKKSTKKKKKKHKSSQKKR